MTTSPALEARELSLHLGGLAVLDEVDLCVEANTIHALIGPNGAGKTSFLNCISGFYTPQSGSVTVGGVDALGRGPVRMAGLGVARVFQNVELFGHATTLENLLLGRHRLMRTNALGDLIASPRTRRAERAHSRHVDDIVEMLRLGPFCDRPAAELPYGVQKRVELGRALAMEPTVLLLDEPVAGMNPEERVEIADLIRHVQHTLDLTILAIEHDMAFVMGLADRVTVLDAGRRISVGTPDEVQADPLVIQAYLGTRADDEVVA